MVAAEGSAGLAAGAGLAVVVVVDVGAAVVVAAVDDAGAAVVGCVD